METHHAGCRCSACKTAFQKAVLDAVLSHQFTFTGAVVDRLRMRGCTKPVNDIRAALWSLQSKPNQRVEVMRRGVSLWWRRIDTGVIL